MGKNSGIQWTTHTFNPWIGCEKISPGCANCYAEAQDRRWGHKRWGKGAPRQRTSPSYWRQPLAWQRDASDAGERHRVFCASLADVCDPVVPQAWRADLAAVIEGTPALDWLLLTKRPEHFGLLRDLFAFGRWPSNAWGGVTVENQEQAERRIPLLLAQDFAVRFLSCEPLLEGLDLSPWLVSEIEVTDDIHDAPDGAEVDGMVRSGDLWRRRARIDWLIIGGESGTKARPFDLAWARSLVKQARAAGVAPFFKQAGSHALDNGSRLRLRDSHGGDLSELPSDLHVREFPHG